MVKPITAKEGQKVVITWHDSLSFPGWRSIVEAIKMVDDGQEGYIESMGTLISINQTRIILAPHHSLRTGDIHTDQVADIMAIPRGCIIGVQVIQLADETS